MNAFNPGSAATLALRDPQLFRQQCYIDGAGQAQIAARRYRSTIPPVVKSSALCPGRAPAKPAAPLDDVDRVRQVIEERCQTIGRKVAGETTTTF